METRIIEIYQRNMYCSKCLHNVIKVLSGLEDVKDFYINMNDKTIKITYHDEVIGKNRIQAMIAHAITNGI